MKHWSKWDKNDSAAAYVEIQRLRATLLNVQALAERGFPIDHAKLATQCRHALAGSDEQTAQEKSNG